MPTPARPPSSPGASGGGGKWRTMLIFGLGVVFGKFLLGDKHTATTLSSSSSSASSASTTPTFDPKDCPPAQSNNPPNNNNNDPTLKLLAPASTIIPLLEKRFEWLDTITIYHDPNATALARAQFAYSELIRMLVSGMAYGEAEKSVHGNLGKRKKRVAPKLIQSGRDIGKDWAYLGYTMTGLKRLHSLAELMEDVFRNKIPGDFIETGVWRGGSCIYAKAILEAHGETHRQVYVCDSFRGLPPGDRSLHKLDGGWDNNPFLEVSEEHVRNHFAEANLLDDRVHFVKGFFKDSMPKLRQSLKPDQKFAIMRLDGDMYQSTVDVLYTLYDRLSIGGYLIMDDWFGFPSKDACEDFIKVHNFQPEIIPIDNNAAYWKKTQEIDIQYWRYEQKKYKPEQSQQS